LRRRFRAGLRGRAPVRLEQSPDQSGRDAQVLKAGQPAQRAKAGPVVPGQVVMAQRLVKPVVPLEPERASPVDLGAPPFAQPRQDAPLHHPAQHRVQVVPLFGRQVGYEHGAVDHVLKRVVRGLADLGVKAQIKIGLLLREIRAVGQIAQ